MSEGKLSLPLARGFGETSRRDLWWVQPLVVFLVLGGFVIYATWAALQGQYYTYGPYLSPFYSPELWGPSEHAWFGAKPGFWPDWLPFSPALLILGIPVGFRMTCYYYRGAYYKAFWADPPNCAVGEPGFRGTKYRGERKWPLLIQNIHRYFFYLAAIFILLLAYAAFWAFWFHDPATPIAARSGMGQFGVGVGSLVLLINVILLGGYTFGCHCARHIAGGHVDQPSNTPVRHACWSCVSAL